ncbi:MAG: septum formation initiator family protein [Bacteroidales bacterium]|nr:septum formation initiator family protein [Bacteroidales bacterium]
MKFKDTIVWKIIKNKYFIAVVLFLLVVCFLDENNLLVVHSLRRDVAQLNHTIDTMRQGFVEDSLQAERLKYDLDSIERYGRENYYMKRKNEDVFVVTQASE